MQHKNTNWSRHKHRVKVIRVNKIFVPNAVMVVWNTSNFRVNIKMGSVGGGGGAQLKI